MADELDNIYKKLQEAMRYDMHTTFPGDFMRLGKVKAVEPYLALMREIVKGTKLSPQELQTLLAFPDAMKKCGEASNYLRLLGSYQSDAPHAITGLLNAALAEHRQQAVVYTNAEKEAQRALEQFWQAYGADVSKVFEHRRSKHGASFDTLKGLLDAAKALDAGTVTDNFGWPKWDEYKVDPAKMRAMLEDTVSQITADDNETFSKLRKGELYLSMAQTSLPQASGKPGTPNPYKADSDALLGAKQAYEDILDTNTKNKVWLAKNAVQKRYVTTPLARI